MPTSRSKNHSDQPELRNRLKEERKSVYRRAIDERDVYAEAEFFHTGCYQLNITTGMIVRGIIASGT